MQTVTEALCNLESVDEELSARLRLQEDSLDNLADLLQRRRAFILRVCGLTSTAGELSYEVLNRMILSLERGRQALALIHNKRGQVAAAIASAAAPRTYADRLMSELHESDIAAQNNK